MTGRRVVWFSCGAASAVAARRAQIAGPIEVVYCDTMSAEHPDNERFFEEVQSWLGQPITRIHSEKYKSVDDVFERARYMSGIGGARCTLEMKKIPRFAYQEVDDVHIFGYTSEEKKRAATFERNNPELLVEWTLIEQGVGKADCLDELRSAGIALPRMYDLGFDHNNCIGCVKATSPGYWNRTRQHFPKEFELRAKQSREIGARLVRVKGKRIFLDELDPKVGLKEPDGDIECGPMCQGGE